MLYAALRPGTVSWESRLVAVSGAGGAAELEFESGATARARVAVGADGIWSAVRRAWGESQGPAYSGVVVVLGFARHSASAELGEHPALRDSNCVLELSDGRGTRLYAMPMEGAQYENGRSTMWQLSWRVDDEARARELGAKGPTDLHAAAASRCAGWAAPAAELIAATRAEDVTGYPVYDRDVDDEASSGVVTLLGDALHPMAPFKAQGANAALLDSVALARALYDSELGGERRVEGKAQRRRSGKSVADAVAEYERAAARRGRRRVEASRNATVEYHWGGGLAGGVAV